MAFKAHYHTEGGTHAAGTLAAGVLVTGPSAAGLEARAILTNPLYDAPAQEEYQFQGTSTLDFVRFRP